MSHSLIPPPPAHSEDSMPHFTANNPCELHHFFAESRFHFSQSQISDNAEKKYHVLHYIDYKSVDLWEILPEFSDPSQTFDEFATAVYRHYPECNKECRWSLRDMDMLIANTVHTGILSLAELGSYYCDFLSITSFLIAKNHLSIGEQSQAFTHGLSQ